MQKSLNILDVRFDIVTLDEATETAINWARENSQKYITTPNPEFLLEAQKNPEFLTIVNNSDLNICDGTGILWASKFMEITKNTEKKTIKAFKWIYSLFLAAIYPKYIKTIIPERVTGVDLMEKICSKCSQYGLKVFLLGSMNNAAERAKDILEHKYQDLDIVGTYEGSPKPKDDNEILEIINNKKPDILFVAYGAPSQELWINRNLNKIPSVKCAMGIGGSYDFIAGYKKRAPKWMQKTGLEWLYRLIQEPRRIKRIFNASIIFPITVLKKS